MRVVDDVLVGDMPNAGSRLSMIVHLEIFFLEDFIVPSHAVGREL